MYDVILYFFNLDLLLYVILYCMTYNNDNDDIEFSLPHSHTYNLSSPYMKTTTYHYYYLLLHPTSILHFCLIINYHHTILFLYISLLSPPSSPTMNISSPSSPTMNMNMQVVHSAD